MRATGVVAALFRRDRLTAQVAVGVVGALCVAAVVFGVGMASAKYQISDVGAWLSSNRNGLVVHANGMAGKVDGKVKVPTMMHGHQIKIVQDGSTILIVDQQTGVVSRIDPAQLSVVKSTGTYAAAGLQVVAEAGAAYTIDAARGTVQRIDPVGLTPDGAATTLTPPLGQGAIDARGTLWVPVPATGEVVPFQAGGPAAPVKVGKPGDHLAITIAAGVPVITDSTAATALVLEPSGRRLTLALPSTVTGAGQGGVLFPATTEGQLVPLLAKRTGSLVLLDTGSGRHSTVSLRVADHRYGPPQILGSKVYIPDQTTGSLVVYDSATNSFQPQIVVNGRPGELEVFVSGGLLWANDPNGERALVLNPGGAVMEISKYERNVPGGPRSPLPTRVAGPGGGDPAPALPAVPTAPSVRRPPVGAPTPPSNLRTSGGDGFMTVEFQPSTGGTPLGYVLKDVPGGMTVTPRQLPPSGSPSFRVQGGQCGREYVFRVAVRYRDRAHRLAEVPSVRSAPVMPCVPPGAPTDVRAVATSGGAQVTWTAPPGGGSAPTAYRVGWTGPTSGSRAGLTGTSVTLGEIGKNGSYTFTVTSSNGAGAGRQAQASANLTGPAQRYPTRHNQNSKAYIRPTPDGTSPDIGSVTGNGVMVTVHCQKRGAFYDRGLGAGFRGDLYDYVEYGEVRGYMIGYLLTTPRDPWTEFAGLPLWQCA
ncbi:fibronectin type III domain-containing protein [Actinomadura sp. HBU206391]|uniref:fibronectin type III domain-containing protein n=1 Tax=Actinomadura sp. HBU206391 TaxID=2731692 RepID=UPI00164FF335|nr:fibronectin type III domain-containing protein [Actinomadura sp. HBU206391]MBC6459500.1 fibronectin type III domain-containing protein [Actinomadura sp. HBU206391]